MSLSPRIQEPSFELSKFDRIQNAVKRSVETYFHDPLHYLLYGGLALVGLALLAGWSLPWQLYALLGGMAAAKIIIYLWIGPNSSSKSE